MDASRGLAPAVRRLVASVGLVLFLASHSQAQAPAHRLVEAADSLLSALHARGLFNGAVVLGRAGAEVYARGFGPANVEAGIPFTYDNLGFDVAALLVERLTGVAWDDFLRERIFDPLGMDSTFLRPARLADWRGVRTMSYRQLGDSLAPFDVWDNEGFYGASNLYFSARDLYRWSRSFYTRPVLSETARTRGMEPPVLRDPATGEGGRSSLTLLSWYYADQGRRYHYPGSIRGFWSYVYRDEDRRYSVVYVTNNDIPQWLRPLLTRALIAIMEGRSPAPINPPAYAELGAEDAIAGAYAVDALGTVTIASRDGQASVQVESGLAYPAYPVGHGQLYVPGLDAWVGFRDTPAAPFRSLIWLSIFRVAEGERIR